MEVSFWVDSLFKTIGVLVLLRKIMVKMPSQFMTLVFFCVLE